MGGESGLIFTEIERRRRKAAMGDKLISMSLNKIFPSTQSHQASPVWVAALRNVFYGACLFVGVCSRVKGCRSDERKEPAAA